MSKFLIMRKLKFVVSLLGTGLSNATGYIKISLWLRLHRYKVTNKYVGKMVFENIVTIIIITLQLSINFFLTWDMDSMVHSLPFKGWNSKMDDQCKRAAYSPTSCTWQLCRTSQTMFLLCPFSSEMFAFPERKVELSSIKGSSW